MRRLLVAPLLALGLAMSALVAWNAPAVAADAPNPCKVVKTSEIAKAFGGADVSKGKKGLTTPVSVQCKYLVGATADLPAGNVIISVMYVGAKPAYDGLKRTAIYVPTTGLANSIYSGTLSVVNTLRGSSLLGVQGLFLRTTPPITNQDVESQLVDLSKVGLKRL
ncbi:MAG: hypothetical protein ACHQIG_07510 [Acidimicrobiia bacterium]